jgi:predicted XRE-type DNA-binding protein
LLFGPNLGEPHTKAFGEGLFELRKAPMASPASFSVLRSDNGSITVRFSGSTLEGRLEEARQIAAKRVLAWQLQQAMESQHLNKVEMAKRMQTSRSQLDRLLDPNNDKVQLDTLNRAAAIVGKHLKIELIDNMPC